MLKKGTVNVITLCALTRGHWILCTLMTYYTQEWNGVSKGKNARFRLSILCRKFHSYYTVELMHSDVTVLRIQTIILDVQRWALTRMDQVLRPWLSWILRKQIFWVRTRKDQNLTSQISPSPHKHSPRLKFHSLMGHRVVKVRYVFLGPFLVQ